MSSNLGNRAAEMLAAFVGSWPFVIAQTIGIGIWVLMNITAVVNHWDPYPFILLNLLFSVQAAYTGPIIMIAQNRQEQLQHKQDKYMLHLLEAVQLQLREKYPPPEVCSPEKE
jgi:uncharacterized membrane protein